MGRRSIIPRPKVKPGLVVGRLTVKEFVGYDKYKALLWLCQCECGNTSVVRGYALLGAITLSCGCLIGDATSARVIQHGLSHTPEYRSWNAMMRRCLNPASKNWVEYGSRGITVCERWQTFEMFLADIGQRPTPKHTLERVDNAKGYEPDNCVWATRKTQSRNRRSVPLVEHDGQKRCVAEWAEITGIHPETIRNRLHRNGWTAERALTTPPRPIRKATKAK